MADPSRAPTFDDPQARPELRSAPLALRSPGTHALRGGGWGGRRCCWKWRRFERAPEQLRQRPDVIREPGLHGGRHPQRLVDAAEVVIGPLEREGGFKVTEPLAEG